VGLLLSEGILGKSRNWGVRQQYHELEKETANNRAHFTETWAQSKFRKPGYLDLDLPAKISPQGLCKSFPQHSAFAPKDRKALDNPWELFKQLEFQI
jgi:hypothetical protein